MTSEKINGQGYSWIPWGAVCTIFLLFTVYLYVKIISSCNGIFVYALDDPYIHLTIARNVALSGIWGIAPGEFSSASSSILWPLILSLPYRFGIDGVLFPFVLNCFFGCAFLLLCDMLFSFIKLSALMRFSLLAAIVALSPYLPNVFSGMEHLL